jgi:hypothetical protein
LRRGFTGNKPGSTPLFVMSPDASSQIFCLLKLIAIQSTLSARQQLICRELKRGAPLPPREKGDNSTQDDPANHDTLRFAKGRQHEMTGAKGGKK